MTDNGFAKDLFTVITRNNNLIGLVTGSDESKVKDALIEIKENNTAFLDKHKGLLSNSEEKSLTCSINTVNKILK